jgi:hypothetical protein
LDFSSIHHVTAKSLPIARKTGRLAIKNPEIAFRVAIRFLKIRGQA